VLVYQPAVACSCPYRKPRVGAPSASFEVEEVEQLTLIARLPTHHGKPPAESLKQTESLFDENHDRTADVSESLT
jgi:hypothetical protein